MRKLLLLVSLVFAVFFGASLWKFSDAASWQNVANYLPLGLMVLTFIIGLLHLRAALAFSLVLIFLFGTPSLLNDLATKVLGLGAPFALFGNFGMPIESVLLGLIGAWVLVRFFGNPELDYEYNRANAVRALHFPVFVLALCAILGAVYAIIATHNVYYHSFWQDARKVIWPPTAFASGAGALAALRAVVRLLEALAVYVIVINEVRSARQVRFFTWLMLICGVVIGLLGLVQYKYNLFYGGVAGFNREIQSTIASPNALGVFLAALLPLCGALILRGGLSGIAGLLGGAVLVAAIVLSETKVAILLTALFLVVLAIVVLVRAIRARAVIPLVLTGILLVAVIVGFFAVKRAAGTGEAQNEFYSKIVKKVTGTFNSLKVAELNAKQLNESTNYKFGDWVTALRMVEPSGEQGLENLIGGVGYGQFANAYNTYRPDWASRSRKGASNMLLQTAADTGIFGALALLLIAVLAIAYGFSSARQLDKPLYARALTWSLLVLVLGCMTENAFQLPQVRVLFWVLVGLVMVSASLSAREGATRGSVLLKALIVLIVLAAWGLVLVPKVETDRDAAHAIAALAERAAERLNLDAVKVRGALERTGDYGFNRRRDRWTEKNAIAMTEVTGPIASMTLFCAHPDVSVSNPVTAVVTIDGEQIAKRTFTGNTTELVEYDMTKNPRLSHYVDNKDRILVRFSVDRTWVPSEVYPQFPDDNFDVGVAVSPISWRTELSPPPPQMEAPEEGGAAPAAAPEAAAAEQAPAEEGDEAAAPEAAAPAEEGGAAAAPEAAAAEQAAPAEAGGPPVPAAAPEENETAPAE